MGDAETGKCMFIASIVKQGGNVLGGIRLSVRPPVQPLMANFSAAKRKKSHNQSKVFVRLCLSVISGHMQIIAHSQKDWLIPLFIIISDNFLFIFSQVH